MQLKRNRKNHIYRLLPQNIKVIAICRRPIQRSDNVIDLVVT
ncbi:putative predicted protein [Rhizobium favelukesii]|uniref:Uncharacterized protein n=1 Tax=Rhizobium favelukesii TaxID=348824 RepID=W6RBN5_9HYPH|nr:putative predicted protein [Rhizobium favelukesii]